ncbi:iron-containing alcohol dehydrogenase [Brevifollis gellanilyticus]|uniref:iron-containing alcohol dehydrogenase n=1 Tax=Brevifollis gellanilyticus TaxID=748831 RepID=UPI0011BEAAB0|nr:iron-containing alcohol dehydrogenase [Brevifollis gellanilyticus]
MTTSFEFATAARVVFGRGTVSQLPALCQPFGRRVLIVTGAKAERAGKLVGALEAAGLTGEVFSVPGEPTLDDARCGSERAKSLGAEVVIGFGGGSAMDAGKAIAALARQPHDALHYLEVVGQGNALDEPPLPYIAVPTTAGTGAEVTRNAVLASPEKGVKASLRHVSMLPRIALVDPELAVGCPPVVTAASGMDALTQCLEAYVSCRAQPMTDALCVDGIRRASRSLEKAVQDGADLDAREDMALAAMYSGMALANAGLGAVHGFAAPIGGQFQAPHGAVCAILLAPVWAANWAVVNASGNDFQRERFRHAGELLTGRADARAEDVLPVLRGLSGRLQIPGLRSYGIQESDLADIAAKAAKASSMKGNPVSLSEETLVKILSEAM